MTDNNCLLVIDPSPAELKHIMKKLEEASDFCFHLLVQSRYKAKLAHRYNCKISTFAELDFIERRGAKPRIKQLVRHINSKNIQKVYVKKRLVSNYFWLWLHVNASLNIFEPDGKLKELNSKVYLQELMKFIFNKYILFLGGNFINLLILPLNVLFYLIYRFGDWIMPASNSYSISMNLPAFCKFVRNVFLKRNNFGNRNSDIQKWKNKIKVYQRYSSALLRQYPNFLLPGVAKCGSTTLLEYLNYHPRLSPGLRKEISYFSANNRYQFGDCWYRCWFPLNINLSKYLNSTPDKKLYYEVSGNYFTTPGVAKRLHSSLPSIRFILLFRNPVRRAYSDYHFRGKMELIQRTPDINSDNINFKKTLDYELDLLPEVDSIDNIEELYNPENKKRFRGLTCFRQGLYYIYLKRWLKYFSRDQFLIIKSENLFEDNMKTLQRVSDFLEIDSFEKTETIHKNKGNYPAMNERNSHRLKELYKPFNHKLYNLIGRDLGWENEL